MQNGLPGKIWAGKTRGRDRNPALRKLFFVFVFLFGFVTGLGFAGGFGFGFGLRVGFFHRLLGLFHLLGAGFSAFQALFIEHGFAAQQFDEGFVSAVALLPSSA